MDDVAPGHVAVARVLSPWGVRGDLKVEPLTDLPNLLSPGHAVTIAGHTATIERSQRRGRFLYLKLSTTNDRSAADALRGRYLQVPEGHLEPLAEGQYYRFQLIGLSVRSTEGQPLGRLTNVLTTPSGDVLVVHGTVGEILVPAVDDFVKEIDLQERTMTIEVVPGLIRSRGKR